MLAGKLGRLRTPPRLWVVGQRLLSARLRALGGSLLLTAAPHPRDHLKPPSVASSLSASIGPVPQAPSLALSVHPSLPLVPTSRPQLSYSFRPSAPPAPAWQSWRFLTVLAALLLPLAPYSSPQRPHFVPSVSLDPTAALERASFADSPQLRLSTNPVFAAQWRWGGH